MSDVRLHDVGLVCFDLDGTLAHTLPDILRVFNAARAQLGLAAVTETHLQGWLGDGPAMVIARSFGTEDADDPRVLDMLPRLLALYGEMEPTDSVLYPGILDLLQLLRAAGVPLAVTTNKPRISTPKALARLRVTAFFDAVLTPDDVAGAKKPAPDMFVAAQRATGVCGSDRVVVIGDSVADVAGGRAAGARTIGLLSGYGDSAALTAAAPTVLLESTADLLPLFA